MDAHTAGVVLLGGAGLAVVVWALHKIGKAMITVFEVLAAAAVVFAGLWWLLRAVVRLFRQMVIHWRTSLTVLMLAGWWQWWGWPSLVITFAVIVVALAVWRRGDRVSFEIWAGRWLRAWWLRWTVYAPKLPGWLHACGVSIKDETTPATVSVTLLGRRPRIRRDPHHPAVRAPRVLGVRSGPSWDEVRVRLVAGQKPEDVEEATGPWRVPGAWHAARSANSPPMSSRSISSTATCSPTRWPAPT